MTDLLSSYATVEQADAYFSERLDSAVWSAASPTEKLKALKAATMLIDNLPLSGRKYLTKEDGQILEFPREYPSGSGWIYDEDDYDEGTDTLNVPDAVIYACCEEAQALLGTTSSLDTTGRAERLSWQQQGISEITIGEVTEKYRLGAGSNEAQLGLISTEAFRLIERYISVSGAII